MRGVDSATLIYSLRAPISASVVSVVTIAPESVRKSQGSSISAVATTLALVLIWLSAIVVFLLSVDLLVNRRVKGQ